MLLHLLCFSLTWSTQRTHITDSAALDDTEEINFCSFSSVSHWRQDCSGLIWVRCSFTHSCAMLSCNSRAIIVQSSQWVSGRSTLHNFFFSENFKNTLTLKISLFFQSLGNFRFCVLSLFVLLCHHGIVYTIIKQTSQWVWGNFFIVSFDQNIDHSHTIHTMLYMHIEVGRSFQFSNIMRFCNLMLCLKLNYHRTVISDMCVL